MPSRSFGTKGPAQPHLVKGSGGLSGEIFDLRADIDEALVTLESQVDGGAVAQASIRLNTQPTAADTITIGTTVFEFVATLGSQTAGRIGVLRGASAAAALANIVDAINQVVPAVVHDGTHTMNIRADIYNTDFLRIQQSSRPGGPAVRGVGASLALSDALTAVIAWDQTNLSNTGSGLSWRTTILRLVVDAVNLAADFDVVLPFTPVQAQVIQVLDGGVITAPNAAKATNTGVALVPARNAVTVDFNGGGGTDVVATDVVYVLVRGY